MFSFRDLSGNEIQAEVVIPYDTDGFNTSNVKKSAKAEYDRLDLSNEVYTYRRLSDEEGAFIGLRLYMDGRMYDIPYKFIGKFESSFSDRKLIPLKSCTIKIGTYIEVRQLSHLERCSLNNYRLCVSHIAHDLDEAKMLMLRFLGFNKIVKPDYWTRFIDGYDISKKQGKDPFSNIEYIQLDEETLKNNPTAHLVTNKDGQLVSPAVDTSTVESPVGKNAPTHTSTVESPVGKNAPTHTSTLESPVGKNAPTHTSTLESPVVSPAVSTSSSDAPVVSVGGCSFDFETLECIFFNTDAIIENQKMFALSIDKKTKAIEDYVNEREVILENERLELYSKIETVKKEIIDDVKSYLDARLVQERGYTQSIFLQLMEAINNINVKNKFSNDFYPMPPALADLIISCMGSGSRTCASDCKKLISVEPMYSLFVGWVREANRVKSSKISEDILNTDNRRLKEWYTILTTRPREDVVQQ